MSGAQLAAWAIEALVASALLIALVLLVRVPVRRAFGPRAAYLLWLLPALRLLLPPIPAAWRRLATDTPISRVGETLTVVMLPSAAPAGPIDVTSVGPSLPAMLLMAWAIVATGFLAFHLFRHLVFCRRVLARGVTVERIARVRVVESDAAAGPMAFGILRPCVAFPRDFAARFDADERALALAHELGHHARGDLLANWIALAVLAVHWFNPLAWRAFRSFRADQELANDARVLAGRSAYERHAYACAIVKAAHGRAVGAACHLHSVQDLKGRLEMLRTQISRRRLAAGAAAVAGLSVAALGLTASGTSAAERIRTQVADATGIPLPPPVAPVPPAAPLAPPAPVAPVAQPHQRVVIVKNGVATSYEGEAARRYLAEHPAPTPPAPPVAPRAPDAPRAPTPPQPPEPAQVVSDEGGAMRISFTVPQVASAPCGDASSDELVRHSVRDGRERITVCTDRIERQAHAAQKLAAQAGQVRLQAMRQALEGLRRSRAAVANAVLAADVREEVMESLKDSMDDLEEELRQPEC